MKRSAAPTYNFQNDNRARQAYKPVVPSFQNQVYSQSTQDTLFCPGTIDFTLPFRRFNVVYARYSNRKHKRWEDDGVLTCQNGFLLLEKLDDGRKRITETYNSNKAEVENLGVGNVMVIGGYELEIQNEIFEQKVVEYNVLCAASELQCLLFERIQDMITLDEVTTTDLFNRLACHPAVLYTRLHQMLEDDPNSIPLPRILDSFPPCYSAISCYVDESGKLLVLLNLVNKFDDMGERCVVAANSKNSLDIIEKMFEFLSFEVYRLDDRTTTVKEAEIQNFNAANIDVIQPKILLLTANTTTCGFDIRSSRRLILFDTDCWSTDEDIKSRIWRDNRKNECYIYRLVTTNSFEEEMFRIQYSNGNEEDLKIVNIDELLYDTETQRLDQTIPA